MDGNSDDRRVWGIHTQDDNLFLSKGIIAIGWKKFGDLSKIDANRDAFKARYIESFPNEKKGQVAIGAGMLYRFIHEMQIGDGHVKIGNFEGSNLLVRTKYKVP